MTTAIVAQAQQGTGADIAKTVEAWLGRLESQHQTATRKKLSRSEGENYRQTLAETRGLAIVATRAAGLEKEAERMEACGTKYSVSSCDRCGEYIGHPYHCDQRICPVCYYRNLSRFMQRHESAWDTDDGFLQMTVNYGSSRSYAVEDGLSEAKEKHKQLIAAHPLMRGGIYHIQLRWDEDYHAYNILYHYMLNAHVNYALFITLSLNGQALVEDYETFPDYATAQAYFVQYCCRYPADILLDYTKISLFLSLMKRKKLIQGFGALYHLAGGLNRGKGNKPQRVCPVCGGKLSFVGLVFPKHVHWDQEYKCYHADPGAPGLRAEPYM